MIKPLHAKRILGNIFCLCGFCILFGIQATSISALNEFPRQGSLFCFNRFQTLQCIFKESHGIAHSQVMLPGETKHLLVELHNQTDAKLDITGVARSDSNTSQQRKNLEIFLKQMSDEESSSRALAEQTKFLTVQENSVNFIEVSALLPKQDTNYPHASSSEYEILLVVESERGSELVAIEELQSPQVLGAFKNYALANDLLIWQVLLAILVLVLAAFLVRKKRLGPVAKKLHLHDK